MQNSNLEIANTKRKQNAHCENSDSGKIYGKFYT